jgi:hypothetical protein
MNSAKRHTYATIVGSPPNPKRKANESTFFKPVKIKLAVV